MCRGRVGIASPGKDLLQRKNDGYAGAITVARTLCRYLRLHTVITVVSVAGWHRLPFFFINSLGENPQFNEAFEFEVAFPELALVRFVVLDDDSLD